MNWLQFAQNTCLRIWVFIVLTAGISHAETKYVLKTSIEGSARADLSKIYLHEWTPNGFFFKNGFIGSPGAFYRHANADLDPCFEVLNHNVIRQLQILAFEKFLSSHLIDRTHALNLLEEMEQLSDNQFVGFQTLSTQKPKQSYKNVVNPDPDYEYYLKFQSVRGEGDSRNFEVIDGELYPTASLILVSGQKPVFSNQGKHDVQPLSLPWALSKSFKVFAATLWQRNDYLLHFELSRAASMNENDFRPLMSLAADEMLRQVLSFGEGSDIYLKHTAVIIRTSSIGGHDHFYRYFSKYRITQEMNHPEQAVFEIPLLDFVRVYGKKDALSAIEQSHVSQVKSEVLAQVQYFIQKGAQQALDWTYRGQHQKTPILMTVNHKQLTLYDAKKLMDYYQVGPQVIQTVVNHTNVTEWLQPGMRDPSNFGLLADQYTKKWIQISNLDSQQMQDPRYAVSAITAVFEHIIRGFNPQQNISPQQANQIIAEMKAKGIVFAVTTAYPQTAAVLAQFKPQGQFTLNIENDLNANMQWEYITKTTGISRPSKNLHVFEFSVDQMAYLRFLSHTMSGSSLPIARRGYFDYF
jgi:hypothetical protein